VLKKSILYFVIFLLAFSVFVVAKAPARIVWDQLKQANPSIQSSLRSVGVIVKGFNGTVWDGSALLQYKGISSILSWDIQVGKIFSLSLPVLLNVESQAGKLNAEVLPGLSGASLSVHNADLDLAMLNTALRAQRVTLDGQLIVKDVELDWDGQRIASAKGLFSWSGGDIAYPAQRAIHQRTLPAFRGVLETEGEGKVRAGIRDSGGAFDLIEANVNPEGEAMVKVKRRLLDLADEYWPQNSKEQDVVFKVKKKIF
jgi:hypothetical protein